MAEFAVVDRSVEASAMKKVELPVLQGNMDSNGWWSFKSQFEQATSSLGLTAELLSKLTRKDSLAVAAEWTRQLEQQHRTQQLLKNLE